MANTTSSAFLKTAPIQDNTGQIVEEHIRYWNKFDSDEEAKRKAEEARQAEFTRKKNKETFDKYKGLSGIEVKGFYEDQIRGYLDTNSDRLLDVSINASKGDRESIIAYNKELQKLQGMINAGASVSSKLTELRKLKESEQFNPVRDKKLNDFAESIEKGNFSITANGDFKMYDADTDNWVDVNPSDLGRNFGASTYHKQVDFGTAGTAIAKTIQQAKTDGEQEITAQNRIDGVRNSVDYLKTHSNELATFALLNNIETPIDELTDQQYNALGGKFYEEHVKQNLQEILNPLGKQAKRAQIASVGQRLEEKTELPQLILTTDTQQQPLLVHDIDGVGEFKGDLFTIGDGGVSNVLVDKNEKRTTTTMQSVGRDENGNFVGFGNKTINHKAIPKTLLNPNSKPAWSETVAVTIPEKDLRFYIPKFIEDGNLADLSNLFDKKTLKKVPKTGTGLSIKQPQGAGKVFPPIPQN